MTLDTGFSEALTRLGQRLTGETHLLGSVRRLTGGANMESWWVDYGPHAWVMRRLPIGINEAAEAGNDTRTGITLANEAKIVTLANDHGVTVPKVIGDLEKDDGLGTGFMMERVAGEAMPHKILNHPDYAHAMAQMPAQCAKELAALHAIPLEAITADIPAQPAKHVVATLTERYNGYGAAIPIFELAIGWLERNHPTARAPALLHGDFRMGNLLIDHSGIAAVLDWELAHIGDPAQDIAYLCTPSWRFGNYDKTAGGFGQIEDLLHHYHTHCGQDIPIKDIQFWLVVAVLTWGMATLKMVALWRSGQDRSLERAVIGTRTSETEIDLLLILEDVLDIEATRQAWSIPQSQAPTGDTDASELLTALIDWDEAYVLPRAEGRDLFQARVARNAMRIVLREAQYGATFKAASSQRLTALGMTQIALCSALRAGQLDSQTLSHLRLDGLERLAIDQPKYTGFDQAYQKWIKPLP